MTLLITRVGCNDVSLDVTYGLVVSCLMNGCAWMSLVLSDPDRGDTYFYNAITKEATWQLPANAVVLQREGKQAPTFREAKDSEYVMLCLIMSGW